MQPRRVTDPDLLASLSMEVQEEPQVGAEGPKRVTDPDLLASLLGSTPQMPQNLPESPVQPQVIAPRRVTDPQLLASLGASQEPVGPNVASGTLTEAQLMEDPFRMHQIREYMVKRHGSRFQDMDSKEVFETFMNHMRFFNVNEVTTLGELRWLNNLSDEEKAIAGNAYKAFDSLGNIFTRGSLSETADGVWDYTRAALLSPSTYIGAGIGRLVAGSATRAGQQAAVRSAMAAARQQAVRQFADPTSIAAQQAGNQAARLALGKASRTVAYNQVAIAGLVDVGANSIQDILYQNAMLDAGAQDTYSILQTGLAAAGGVVGAGVAALPLAMQGTAGLSRLGERISLTSEREVLRVAEKAMPQLREAAKVLKTELSDWLEMAKQGRAITDSVEFMDRVFKLALDTNPDSPTSLIGVMVRSGVVPDRSADAATISLQLVSFAERLPQAQRTEINELFKEAVGMSFGDMLDIIASTARTGGQWQNILSQASKALGDRAVATELADNNIASLAHKAFTELRKQKKEPPKPEHIRYMQSLWRRALVSHPATSAINVMGWGQAAAARNVAELLHGGILGTAGLTGKMLSPVSTRVGKWADKQLIHSKQLFESQYFKVSTLFDPYDTINAAQNILSEAPTRTQDELWSAVFGGVNVDSVTRHNLNPNSRVVKGVEKLSNKAAKYSGVKLQDMVTKSFSFVWEMDRQLRKATGRGLSQYVDEGRVANIPPEIWERATRAAMEDTFSADFTKVGGALGPMAKAIETISNTPGLGFLFPFGRFMNNTMAFTMAYSPIGLMNMASKARRHGIWSDDAMESLTKAVVGTVGLYMAYQETKRQVEEGIPLHSRELSTGQLIDRQNLAPFSVFYSFGRLAEDWKETGRLNPELTRDFGDQLGPFRVIREMGQNPLGDILELFHRMGDDEAGQTEILDIFLHVGAMAANIGSGFTRPLEPINMVTGQILNNDIIIDRRLTRDGDKVYTEATRYVDNIIDAILHGPRQDRPFQRQDLTRFGTEQEPNPMARMLSHRERQPQNDINRMLAMVNMMEWGQQERTGIPEWDALVNEWVTPRLERRARELIRSNIWNSSDRNGRERLVRQLLNQVKSETREFVSKELGWEESVLRERRNWTSVPRGLREEAKAHFGIRTKDEDLNAYQLELLNFYITNVRQFERTIIRE